MQIAFKKKKPNIPLETHNEMNLGDKVPSKQFNVTQRIFQSTTNFNSSHDFNYVFCKYLIIIPIVWKQFDAFSQHFKVFKNILST